MLLICMGIAGTLPLMLCVLLMIIRRKNFSYRLGRELVFLSLAGYLIPFQLIKYFMPLDVLESTDSLNVIVDFVNFDNKEALSYRGISIWMSDWALMIVLCCFSSVCKAPRILNIKKGIPLHIFTIIVVSSVRLGSLSHGIPIFVIPKEIRRLLIIP